MPHVWDNDVLGGTGVPRIMSVDQNQCSNPYFDENTTGWTSNGSFVRIVDTDAFGEYMGRLPEDAAPSTYAYYQNTDDDPIVDRIWLVSFRVKSSESTGVDFEVQLRGSSVFKTETINITDEIKRVVLIATATSQTGNDIQFRIYGKDGAGSTYVYFDDVYFTEVFADYTFPQPHSSYLRFDKRKLGQNELLLGTIQEFGKKWRPRYYCHYDYLDDVFEIYRQAISEATVLFCIPHYDVDWGFLGIWDREFFRQYSFGRFFGHKGPIPIKGIQLLTTKPIYQSGEGTLYFGDELIY